MNCADCQADLLEYIEGGLPAECAAEIEQHLDHCPACAVQCRETRRLVADLGGADSGQSLRPGASDAAAPAREDAAALPAGELEDFEILAELGRGGMGVVYRARQKSLNRIVALKLLAPGLFQSERARQRFRTEAQAAARLHHPNIVAIYAQGEATGRFFYAMELIEGPSLDEALRTDPQLLGTPSARRSRAPSVKRNSEPSDGGGDTSGDGPDPHRSATVSGRLSRLLHAHGENRRDYRRIGQLFAEVADALAHAHAAQVVHRDIKPQNLLLGPEGKLHIADFGLARLVDEPGVTLSTEMVGTPAYMAPEQIGGRKEEVNHRTDVYALGVTLYETITGRRPFVGESYQEIIARILRAEPSRPRRIDPHIPRDLETICLHAMEKEPKRRFVSAAALADDLARFVNRFPIRSRPIGPLGRSWRWVQRHPARSWAAVAVLVLLVLTPLLLNLSGRYQNQRIDRAFEIVMADYRDGAQALAELDRGYWPGGDGYRRKLVRAFALIRTQPQETERLARELATLRPDDPDPRYLLAWSLRRRLSQDSAATWPEARDQIAAADRLPRDASAAGWLFRGQAVAGTDPKEAIRSYDQAIGRRPNFVQAMLHQSRAMNQVLYLLREVDNYPRAVANLEFVCAAQPGQAYPRYLLSITHTLAAEIFAANARNEEAALAHASALQAARAAQSVQPSSARGYAAEAQCWESQGRYEAALQAWERAEPPTVQLTRSDVSERAAYCMRLHFWTGADDAAEQARTVRYSAAAGYDADGGFDADESFYAALIALGRGDRAAARRQLRAGRARAAPHAEGTLLLYATQLLVGESADPPVDPAALDFETHLSPGWSASWLRDVADYQLGRLDWEELLARVDATADTVERRHLLLGGAYFHRGMKALAAGRRADAQEAFELSSLQHDNENYCFRAKMIAVRLRADPAWPF